MRKINILTYTFIALALTTANLSAENSETSENSIPHIERIIQYLESDGIKSYKVIENGHLIVALKMNNGVTQQLNIRPDVYELLGERYIEIWSMASAVDKESDAGIYRSVLLEADNSLFPYWKLLPFDEDHDALCAYITLREDIGKDSFLNFAGMMMNAASEMKLKIEKD